MNNLQSSLAKGIQNGIELTSPAAILFIRVSFKRRMGFGSGDAELSASELIEYRYVRGFYFGSSLVLVKTDQIQV